MHLIWGLKNREKIKKLQTFDLSYFLGKSHLDDDGSQIYLILQPNFESFKIFTVFLWKSKGLWKESITAHATSDNSFTQKLTYIQNSEITLKFERNGLEQDKVSFTHRKNYI